jgi:hypothetical protein
MNIFFIILILFFVTVVVLTMARQEGRLKFLDKQLRLGRRGTTLKMAESKREPYAPRKYESLILLIFGLSTLKIADYISKYLFLCFLYGLSHVRSEGLHFTDMSKGHPWIVSNGDQIDRNLHPLLFVICAVIWVIPTFVGFVLIRRLLPKRNAPATSGGANSAMQEHLVQKPTERRSLVEKGRPFRTRSLLFLLYWVLAMVFFFASAHWIGRVVLILMPVTSIILYIIYFRSNTRHFVSMMSTTSCPQCGQVPMRYEPPGDENARKHLLICDKCHIEWDLGTI